MASIINASTASGGGLVQTADASGILALQSNGTTIASVTSTGLAMSGSTSGTITLAAPAVAGSNTITGNSLSILSSGTLAIDGAGSLGSTATDAVKVPAGTTAQRPTALVGHIRYNSTLGSFEGYNGTQWGNIGGGATGGGSDTVFIQNSKTVTTNYTIPSTQNAMCTGTITINSGVTVTVPTGSRWVIL